MSGIEMTIQLLDWYSKSAPILDHFAPYLFSTVQIKNQMCAVFRSPLYIKDI